LMIGGKAVVLDAETMQPGMSISYVAGRHGLSPSLMFRWRRLMSEGGKEAVRADDEVVAASDSAASKNGCVSSSGCWAARPRRSKSSRRRSNWRGQKTDLAVALAAGGRYPKTLTTLGLLNAATLGDPSADR